MREHNTFREYYRQESQRCPADRWRYRTRGAGLGPVVIDPDAGEGSALKKGRAAPEANVGDEGDRTLLPRRYRVARSQKRGTPRRLRPSRGAESAGA
jgi:hypothetical protein